MGLFQLRIAFGNLFHIYVVRICDSAHFRPFKIHGVILAADCIRKVSINQVELKAFKLFLFFGYGSDFFRNLISEFGTENHEKNIIFDLDTIRVSFPIRI